MPELPEVETIRSFLSPLLTSREIVKIHIYNKSQFVGDPQYVLGSRIVSVDRIGKVLLIHCNTDHTIQIHLKMSGQLLTKIDDKNEKYVRISLQLDNFSSLFFLDPRKFGWMKITPTSEESRLIDVLSPQFTLPYFSSLTRSKQPIKILLMDQSKLAGIGNIYANEALFLSHIRPDRLSPTLSNEEISCLYIAIKSVIHKGIQTKGSSATHVYRLPDGTKGAYQNHFMAYSREDKPCLQCKRPIIRTTLRGRGTFYCKHCQK